MNFTNITLDLSQRIQKNATTCVMSEDEWLKVFDNNIMGVLNIVVYLSSFLFFFILSNLEKNKNTPKIFYFFSIIYSFFLIIYTVFILTYTKNYLFFIPFLYHIIYFNYVAVIGVQRLIE